MVPIVLQVQGVVTLRKKMKQSTQEMCHVHDCTVSQTTAETERPL